MKVVKAVTEIGGKLATATALIPEKWDEVPGYLYPTLAQLYLAPDDQLSKYDKTYRALMLFCDDRHVLKVFRKLNADEIYDILPLVDWVFDQMDLKKNHQPRFKKTKTMYFGPEEGLRNMRFAEWVMADTYYCGYAKDKDEESLNNLVATLYRPQGKGEEYLSWNVKYRGDVREKFNDALLPARAEIMGKLSLIYREAIYLWFASCRWQLQTRYKEIFESGGERQNTMLAGYGWFGIYDDLRGDPKFGGPAALEEEFIHTIFQSLVRSHYKYLDLKREYNI